MSATAHALARPQEHARQSAARQLAARIAATATDAQAESLRIWSAQLLSLRAGSDAEVDKVTRAIAITAAMPGVLPAARLIADDIRRSTWLRMDGPALPRLGQATLGRPAPGTGRSPGGSQGCSPLALLGSAIAVPHWIVAGAGGPLACALLAALDARHSLRRAAAQAAAAEASAAAVA